MGAAGMGREVGDELRAGGTRGDVAAVEQDVAARLERRADGGKRLRHGWRGCRPTA